MSTEAERARWRRDAARMGDDEWEADYRGRPIVLDLLRELDAEQAATRRAAADERARITWWLRAGCDGPARVNTDPAVLDALRELADVLEQHPERWADAPAGGPQ